MTSNPKELAEQFLAALAANDATHYEAVLSEDAALRLGRWDGSEIYRPRQRAVQRLMDEWSAWADPILETFTVMAEGDKAAIEFRIRVTEKDRYVEHNRSAFLTIKDDKIQVIDLYCNEPVSSERPKGWIAPAALTETQLNRLFDSLVGDWRETLAPEESVRDSLRGFVSGSGNVHPASNIVGRVRWTAEEADRKIAETIAYHRDRNVGFSWWVMPDDTPTDLCTRLERQGMVLAGDLASMAHTQLDQIEIPVNPQVEIEVIDSNNEEAIDAMAHILMTCFNIPAEEMANWRALSVEQLRDPEYRKVRVYYLARLNGQPGGFGRLGLRSGLGFLSGGSVLPEFRSRHVYSTLLRRRMEDARARGYHIVAIRAGPLSRPIVARYGFKEYSRVYHYGWMPVIDMEVIKSLVPQ